MQSYFRRFSACLFAVVAAFAMHTSPASPPGEAGSLQPGLAPAHQALTTQPHYSPQRNGPYGVGRTTISYVDASRDNRPVVIDVWYPIVKSGNLTPSVYDLVFTQLPSTQAKADAPIANGDFPLLVFSHGSQGIRFQSFFLTEALASHGFIVAAPDHAGNTAADLIFNTTQPFEQVAIDRPLDVSYVISRMVEQDQQEAGPFFQAVDESRIGALGHSFGGFTTLATASGYNEVVPADERVSALAPFAPASGILSDIELSSISQPTLILGGTADTTTPIDNQSTRPFELMMQATRVQVDILDAGHQSFTNICTFTDALLDAGIPDTLIAFLLGSADDGCAPDLIPIEQAHRLTQLYMVAFFQRYLNQNMSYQTYLNPAFTDIKALPAIVFEATP